MFKWLKKSIEPLPSEELIVIIVNSMMNNPDDWVVNQHWAINKKLNLKVWIANEGYALHIEFSSKDYGGSGIKIEKEEISEENRNKLYSVFLRYVKNKEVTKRIEQLKNETSISKK